VSQRLRQQVQRPFYLGNMSSKIKNFSAMCRVATLATASPAHILLSRHFILGIGYIPATTPPPVVCSLFLVSRPPEKTRSTATADPGESKFTLTLIFWRVAPLSRMG
jgi:hypothetical protein